jgi:hypothetical protein
MNKSGRFMTSQTFFDWPLVVVDRRSFFRGSFSTKIAWVGLRVVVFDMWPSFGSGR